MKQETMQRLQGLLQRGVDTRFVAGANLLVLEHGEEACYLEAGMADLEAGTPLRRDTIFRLYSMSKPITAAAALLLVERGVLELLDPVSDYLPAFAHSRVLQNGELVPPERPVRIQDLLNMTSGLVYGDEPGPCGEAVQRVFDEMEAKHLSTLEGMNRLGECPLQFQPGSYWMYGTSADVLGAVIEAASGMRFGEFLRQELFLPLGMTDTGFSLTPEQLPRLAAAYRTTEAGLVRYNHNHLNVPFAGTPAPAFESGGAGLFSTIDDYARFARMLRGGGELAGVRVLRPGTVRFLTTSHLTPKQQRGLEPWGYLNGYSYANLMRLCTDPGQAAFFARKGEYGWDGWLGCYFANFPGEDLTFLAMYQRVDSGTTRFTCQLRNALLQDLP